MRRAKKFLLLSHPEKPDAIKAALETRRWLQELGMEAVHNEMIADADIAISCGGDGFVLDTANRLAELGYMMPLARINFGTSGFLTNIEPAQIKEKLGLLMDGCYVVEFRNRLAMHYANADFLPQKGITAQALNDIVVERRSAKTIRLKVVYGNETVDIWGDGLLIATRTGSTGYNRNLGGPIIVREDSVVLKPMACAVEKHSAYVLPIETEFTITAMKNNESRIVIDGKELAWMANGSTITVKMAEQHVRFVEFGSIDW